MNGENGNERNQTEGGTPNHKGDEKTERSRIYAVGNIQGAAGAHASSTLKAFSHRGGPESVVTACAAPEEGKRPYRPLSRLKFSSPYGSRSLNRPGFRGGCLVLIMQLLNTAADYVRIVPQTLPV